MDNPPVSPLPPLPSFYSTQTQRAADLTWLENFIANMPGSNWFIPATGVTYGINKIDKIATRQLEPVDAKADHLFGILGYDVVIRYPHVPKPVDNSTPLLIGFLPLDPNPCPIGACPFNDKGWCQDVQACKPWPKAFCHRMSNRQVFNMLRDHEELLAIHEDRKIAEMEYQNEIRDNDDWL